MYSIIQKLDPDIDNLALSRGPRGQGITHPQSMVSVHLKPHVISTIQHLKNKGGENQKPSKDES